MSEVLHAILEPYYKSCDESRADETRLLVMDFVFVLQLVGLAFYLLTHYTTHSFDALAGLAVLWTPALHYRRKMS